VKSVKTTVNPEDFGQLSKLARRAWAQNDWKGFHRIVELLCRFHAHQAESIFLAGLDFKIQGMRTEAKQAFGTAMAMDATRYDAAIELADLESVSRNPERAFELLEKYAPMLHNSPLYADMAGTCYVNIGLPEKAVPLHQIAYELQPSVDIFVGNLAASLGFIGDTERAEALYKELLSRNPKHQRNHYHLARLRKAESDEHLAQMAEALSGDDARDIFLLNAIGKENEDIGNFDAAFEYYQRAADAVYERTLHDVNFDIDILLYQKNKLVGLGSMDQQAPRTNDPIPIFILGLPRTGSTLLEQMLARHESIETLGETDFIDAALREVTQVDSGVQRLSKDLLEAYDDAPDPQAIREYYFRKVGFRLSDKPFFVDKMPYNFLLVDKILAAFPEAVIIHTLRDPIDTCFSMYKQIFTNAYPYSYSLGDLKKYYFEYADYAEKLSRNAPRNYTQIRYEDFVSDTRSVLESLCGQMSLTYSDELLMQDAKNSISMTASAGQIRQGVSPNYKHNWRNFERHLSVLADLANLHG
jgi:tetratricopeptide (TPR) repeat protein